MSDAEGRRISNISSSKKRVEERQNRFRATRSGEVTPNSTQHCRTELRAVCFFTNIQATAALRIHHVLNMNPKNTRNSAYKGKNNFDDASVNGRGVKNTHRDKRGIMMCVQYSTRKYRYVCIAHRGVTADSREYTEEHQTPEQAGNHHI